MQTFHHEMMARLDEAQKSGKTLGPLHAAIRRAFREANMRGRAISTPEELAAAIRAFTPIKRRA